MGSCLLEHLKAQPFWVIVLFTLSSFSLLQLSLFSPIGLCQFPQACQESKKYGSWALVTRPINGIGKAFAFQLAWKWLNLILVGRNLDKLKDVSDAILAKYGKTQIKTIVVNFTGDLDDDVMRTRERIEGLDVGLLINNVWISYMYARFFHEVDSKLLRGT